MFMLWQELVTGATLVERYAFVTKVVPEEEYSHS
jgi:hypothetical protein